METLMHRLEDLLAKGGSRKDIVLLAISGAALLLGLFKLPLPFNIAWMAIILCGVPIVLEAVIGLVTAFDIKADVLVSLALIASVCIGEVFAAGEVAFIMQLGGLLEDLTVSKARAGIENLVRLTPQTAHIVSCADGASREERVVPAEEVQVGDILRVLPGETVPVDGVITAGQTSINQAVMTGESLPVDKAEGDEVSSGTVNQFGAFEMRATKVGENSSIQRMIRLVQSADAGKAKIVSVADRWATWIVVIALSAAAITWGVTGQIIRAVTILVVFCPCALVLATPTAIMAAIGNATKHGFLVREGDALERLAQVTKITFDKTGTLTYGTPEVVHVQTVPGSGVSSDELFELCAAAERLSEHPLGKAVVRSFKQKLDYDGLRSGADADQQADGHKAREIPQCEDFEMVPGRGVGAKVLGRNVLAGNRTIMGEHGVDIPDCVLEQAEGHIEQGCTLIYVALDGKLAGFIALSDTVREASAGMIAQLKSLGVQPVLLTGDNTNAATAIASQLGIDEVRANCLPEGKLNHIATYQEAGEEICMIGDGVNDAPALKKSNVGIAMGGVGSDIAVDAADIALVDDEVAELPHLIALSKRMMRTIKLNLTFSLTLNFVAMVLAILGILNPVIGALVHNAGSVLVIVNSTLLLSWKTKSGAAKDSKKRERTVKSTATPATASAVAAGTGE